MQVSTSSKSFPPYLELILLVFGAFVKGPVVSEPPDVIELVETFDVVRHAVSLQHILTLRDGGYGVDLQVWKRRTLRKAQDSKSQRAHERERATESNKGKH